MDRCGERYIQRLPFHIAANALTDHFGSFNGGRRTERFNFVAFIHCDISGMGCCKGGKDEACPCVQKDDMTQIYPAYRNADVVVLASPMYYWGISGQLKSAFDRLFAVAELTPNYENPKKDCVLLMAAEGNTESNFAPVRAFYEGLTSHLGWKNIGVVYAGGNMDSGDILSKSEQLEEAEKLGNSIS